MTAPEHFSVLTVIGTGSIVDRFGVIALSIDWSVPQNCAAFLFLPDLESCDVPISRIYVLDKPLENHRHIGVCEAHHAELAGEHA